jgi:toxin-antitoxin system PIN domain toxin
LDVNVLIAILDQEHDHHLQAKSWFQKDGHPDWLTCPTTENGVIRIMSLPSYPRLTTTPATVLDSLESLRRKGNHSFEADIVSLLDNPRVERSRILASKQVTDTYLLALAVHHGAVLVTLDHRLSPIAVKNGSSHLLKLL